MTTARGSGDQRHVSPYGVLATVCASILIIGLNTTAINTAVGAIAQEFGMSATEVAWAVNGYLLAAAAFVAPGGQFGDLFGRRRMFGIGLGIFAVGSVVIATAPDALPLILGRVLQGTGSAILLPAQLSLIRLVFPPERQGTAVGIWAAVASLTFAIGPLYGGLFADTVGWRWLFWIDLVLLGTTGLLALRYLRPLREQLTPARADLPGAALLAVGIFALVLALQQGAVWGWASPAILVAAAGGVALLVAFWFVEHRVQDPLVHFGLLRNQPYLGGVVTTFAQGVGLLGYLYFTSIYVESYALYDYSPLGAGLVLLPGGAAMFLGALAAGPVADRIGYRIPNTFAMAAIGVGAIVLATADTGTSIGALAAMTCLVALGAGIGFSTTSAAGMAAVPPHVGGEAAGMINVARYLGTVLAVGLGTVLAAQVSTAALDDRLDDIGVSAAQELDLDRALAETAADLERAIDATAADRHDEVRAAVEAATTDGFRASLLLLVVVGLGAAAASWVLFRSEAAPEPVREPAPEPAD